MKKILQAAMQITMLKLLSCFALVLSLYIAIYVMF